MLRIEPLGRGEGYVWASEIKGGSIPQEFITPINKGVVEKMASGILAGYPVVDMKVTVYDGSYHDVDSSEMAFKIAGSMAIEDAAKHADMVLLEPVMNAEVTVPDEFMGDIMGDLSSKRAQIQGSESRGNATIIKALVPLAEMFGYTTNLRSMTQGRGTSVLLPSH